MDQSPHGGPLLQSNGEANSAHRMWSTWRGGGCNPRGPWLPERPHLSRPRLGAPRKPNIQGNCPWCSRTPCSLNAKINGKKEYCLFRTKSPSLLQNEEHSMKHLLSTKILMLQSPKKERLWNKLHNKWQYWRQKTGLCLSITFRISPLILQSLEHSYRYQYPTELEQKQRKPINP